MVQFVTKCLLQHDRSTLCFGSNPFKHDVIGCYFWNTIPLEKSDKSQMSIFSNEQYVDFILLSINILSVVLSS